MSIQLSCAACGRQHQAPESLAGQRARCACGSVLAIPALSAAAESPGFRSAGLQFYEDAQRELKAREAEEAANLPLAVRLVLGGTLAAGGVSLLLTVLFAFGLAMSGKADRLEDLVFAGGMVVICGALAAFNLVEAALIYRRIPAARPLGYAIAVANLCGGPVHWACAVLCFIGLSSADMTKYLGRR